jgi:uncharacterized hydrophobic protein (TIGR00341 family)
MPQRVMQICLPQGADPGEIDDVINGGEVLGQWEDAAREQTILQLLVEAEKVEPITDVLERKFARDEGFRVVLLAVEAVFPRPDKKEDSSNEESSSEEDVPAGPKRLSREELYDEANESIGVTRVFLGMTVLSAMVAAVGLMREDIAVIIGAMVLAPLLGPNVAMALATTLGDTQLLRRALVTNAIGITLTFLLAVAAGMIYNVDTQNPAIAGRTKVDVGDIVLALASGAAGTLAFTRGPTSAVIGVMVAVALMPPLVTAGLLLGGGHERLALGAGLLTGTNVICINLAGIATFLVQGVRPRRAAEAKRAQSGVLRAVVIWIVLLGVLLLVLWFSRETN